MRAVHVIGVGMSRFGRFWDRSVKALAGEALELALADAEVERADLEGVWFANSAWGMNGGQDCIRGQVALRPAGLEAVPIINVENACAGGATALHAAILAVQSGACEVALALGAEKVYQPARLKMFASFLGGLDVEALPELAAEAERQAAEAPPPAAARAHERRPRPRVRWDRLRRLPGTVRELVVIADHYRLDLRALLGAAVRGGGRSPFMDVYAIAARRHMARYGTTARQLAIIAAKNHEHGALNPRAQRRRPLGPDEVLAAPLVAAPLTRPMCAPIGDGAAAVIIGSAAAVRRRGRRRAVRVRASVLGSGARPSEGRPGITERTSARAYAQADLGAAEVDLVELHDATAFGELHQTEALGLCGAGEGGRLAESGATRLGGRVPVNPSGGLEARGHPIGASGLAQICELVEQLRGEAGPRQVAGARLALAQNGGGMLQGEEAAMGIHILEGAPVRAVGRA